MALVVIGKNLHYTNIACAPIGSGSKLHIRSFGPAPAGLFFGGKHGPEFWVIREMSAGRISQPQHSVINVTGCSEESPPYFLDTAQVQNFLDSVVESSLAAVLINLGV
jgi:hypothetical protein